MAKKNELKRIKSNNKELTKYDFIICPNCGETEVGKYCPNCGQSNKNFNKPIKAILGDLLDSIDLDIRLLNTLTPFFTKPGFLAQEYFKGKRKKYVPPMRMYMIFSIIFFFLIQYTEKNDVVKLDDQNEQQASLLSNKDLDKDSHFLENFNIIINDSTDTVGNSEAITLNEFSEADLDEMRQNVLEDTSISNPLKKLLTGAINASENRDLFFSKFLKNLSYVLFLLMPVFALILAMVLWRSKMLYVKHLIFSINFHSFIFGLFSIIIVLSEFLPDSISGFVLYLWLGFPLYLMMGIKRFYNRNYIGSFFKTLGSLVLYSIINSIVVIFILLITAREFYNV